MFVTAALTPTGSVTMMFEPGQTACVREADSERRDSDRDAAGASVCTNLKGLPVPSAASGAPLAPAGVQATGSAQPHHGGPGISTDLTPARTRSQLGRAGTGSAAAQPELAHIAWASSPHAPRCPDSDPWPAAISPGPAGLLGPFTPCSARDAAAALASGPGASVLEAECSIGAGFGSCGRPPVLRLPELCLLEGATGSGCWDSEAGLLAGLGPLDHLALWSPGPG
jgi:hypothetical protein